MPCRCAVNVPNFHFETRNVPSTTNALGIKGAGEAGSIGSCPAIMNAIAHALQSQLRHRAYRHARDALARVAGDTGRAFLIA